MTSWNIPHAFSWGALSNYVWTTDTDKLVSHCVNLSTSGVNIATVASDKNYFESEFCTI